MMTSATADGRTFRYIYTAGNERIAAVERVPGACVLRNRTTFTLRGTGNQLLSTWTDDWTSGSRVFTRKEDTIWRGSQLLARAAGATAMNYSLDHLGSPRLITNSAGAVLDQQHFEPFRGGLFGSGALQSQLLYVRATRKHTKALAAASALQTIRNAGFRRRSVNCLTAGTPRRG